MSFLSPQEIEETILSISYKLRPQIAFPRDVHPIIIDDMAHVARPMKLVWDGLGVPSTLIITSDPKLVIVPRLRPEKRIIFNLDHQFPVASGRCVLRKLHQEGHVWPVGSTTAEDFRRACRYVRPWRHFACKLALSLFPTESLVLEYIRFNIELVEDLSRVR